MIVICYYNFRYIYMFIKYLILFLVVVCFYLKFCYLGYCIKIVCMCINKFFFENSGMLNCLNCMLLLILYFIFYVI